MINNPTLRRGDEGQEFFVRELQTSLQKSGHYKGTIDGLFGPNTERAVVKFQRANNMLQDGVVGDRTWKRLIRSPESSFKDLSKNLTEKALHVTAESLDVPVAALKAFSEVESSGSGFLLDGRVKILFEQHWMYRLLKQTYGEEKADEFKETHSEVVDPTPGNYAGGTGAWDRFNIAAQLNRECAIQSCSYGRFQLMGFHWKGLEYKSPDQFFNAMMASEDEQLDGIARFIKADSRLLSAIQRKKLPHQFIRHQTGVGL